MIDREVVGLDETGRPRSVRFRTDHAVPCFGSSRSTCCSPVVPTLRKGQ